MIWMMMEILNKIADTAIRQVPFELKYIDANIPAGHTFVGVADLDVDGKSEVLVYFGGQQGYLSWYASPGFQKNIIAHGNYHPERPCAVDIDNDGDLDLFVTKGEERVAVWLENPLPDGQLRENWKEHVIGNVGIRVKDYATGDFDMDGKMDLVFAGYEGAVIFFQNNPQL